MSNDTMTPASAVTIYESSLQPADLEQGKKSVRVYASGPERVTVQIRARVSTAQKGGKLRNMIASAELNQAQLVDLHNCIGQMLRDRGWFASQGPWVDTPVEGVMYRETLNHRYVIRPVNMKKHSDGYLVLRDGVEIAGPSCVGTPGGFKTIGGAQNWVAEQPA